MGELFRVLTGKGNCTPDVARARVQQWTDSFEVANSTWSAFQSGFDLTVDHNLQIWDALILSIAAESRCRILLSEDMQNGFTCRGVTVVNPYSDTINPLLLPLLMRL
jgi:predicted nucleic acid-binding protein